MRKLLIVLDSQNYEDYKFTSTVRRNNSLARSNERLAKKIEKAEKLNKELESSSSWKITRPLRKVMDKLR